MAYKDPVKEAERTRWYQETYREEITERNKRYRETHRAELAKKARDRRLRNPVANRERTRRYQRERWELANSFKERPCMDCGIQYPPCVMDFDHREDERKEAMISRLRGSKVRLLAEIAKCDVVCANCHRLRTCKTHHTTHHFTPELSEATGDVRLVVYPNDTYTFITS